MKSPLSWVLRVELVVPNPPGFRHQKYKTVAGVVAQKTLKSAFTVAANGVVFATGGAAIVGVVCNPQLLGSET